MPEWPQRKLSAAPAHINTSTVALRQEKKPVMCFNCHQPAHKSPQCPKKATTTVRQIQIPINRVKSLKKNEIMRKVEKQVMLITVDTGAEIFIVPEQGVEDCQCMGEVYTVKAFDSRDVTGKLCNVKFTVGNRTFKRKAITQSGEAISSSALIWRIRMT